mmetsp:Transcript_27492/g.49502  ORF Transcript_27492/g.49502 Transcript_27492/m.49502 type:complete len:105 (-) Transcript_27492:1148-1462(-)
MDFRKVGGSEGFQRINFLFQAAVAVYQTCPAQSQIYIASMRELALKLVLRLSPDIKRTYCKACSFLLACLPRRVEHQGKKKFGVVECPGCGKLKRTRLSVKNAV